MAAARKIKTSDDLKLVKVLVFSNEEGGYCIREYEMFDSVIEANATLRSRSEPDVFAIFNMHLIKKAREILGI
jgi:hypothetical protein